jgi:hypothetical protein
VVVCEVLSPSSFGSLTPRTPFTVVTRSDAFYRRYFTTADFCTMSTPVPTLSSSYSLIVLTHEDYKQ